MKFLTFQVDPADKLEARLCLVPQNPIYQLYATIVAFYLPLTVILILNTQIYRIARKIINRVGQSGTVISLSSENIYLNSQEKKSPCLSRHFLVTNSTVNHQTREKSRALRGRKEEGAEPGGRHGGDKPAEAGEEGEEGEEAEDGDQTGAVATRQNVCVINACQVSIRRGSGPCLIT